MLELLPKLEEWKIKGILSLLVLVLIVILIYLLGDLDNRARLVRDNRLQATVNTGEGGSNSSGSVGLDLFQEEIKKRLAHLLRTRVLRGFPINIPFTDVDEILTQIKSFCVHENNNPEVQFVLAVKAMPLFNHTISLWIFIGTLEVTNSRYGQ